MTYRTTRRGFSKTHQTCPCPKQENGCFSVFYDGNGAGYCFACSKVVTGTGAMNHPTKVTASHTVHQQQEFVSATTVMETTGSIINVVSTFGNMEGHQEARYSYAELRAEGVDHTKALRRSGYRAVAISRLAEIRELVLKLPAFFRTLIFSTGVPDILNAFHVGYIPSGEVVFWLADPQGRVCNGQLVPYDGLNRSTKRPTRYMFRSSDGYVVTAFFGAEQLRNGSLSWTQQPFAPFAPVVIVESPKSAILGSLLHPEAIWLASCGASGVTPAKAQALRGRDVCILFDNDLAGREGSQRAVKVLLEAGAFAQNIDPVEYFGGNRPDGWDIGDEALHVIGEQQ